MDSGCTDHMISSEKYFEKSVVLRNPIDVNLPDGTKIKATKIGNVKTYFKVDDCMNEIKIGNVYFVKGLNKNILSFAKIAAKAKIEAQFDVAKIIDTKNNEVLAVAQKVDNLYFLKSYKDACVKSVNEIFVNETKLTQKERWHRALGHVNFKYLDKIIKDKLLNGLPEKLEREKMKCATCIESKMTNKPFENNREHAKSTLEIVHTDLNGPQSILGYKNQKYFLTFVDDYSKCARIYVLKSKTEVAGCLKDYANLVENKLGKRIKKFQCDKGTEYLNDEIYNFVREKGIKILPCPTDVHELNGVAERYNRSVMDVSRCLCKEAGVSKIYWPEMVETAAYLKNRTIANTIENKTPYEIFFGKKPNVKHLKIYGSRVFVRESEKKRKKWDDKSEMGVLVGYTHFGYRVLKNNKVIEARHVEIVDKSTKLICMRKQYENSPEFVNFDLDESTAESCENDDEVAANEASDGDAADGESNAADDLFENVGPRAVEVPDQRTRRASVRNRKRPERFGDAVSHCIYVNYVNANVPSTYEDAINSSESREWRKAMDEEILCLDKNETWQVVERPRDKKVIDVKWVYKRKPDGKCKARLVVRGFQQREHLENVYSPVGKMQTLKVLLSYSCMNDLHVEQMDVETAFLNGEVESEVYVYQPEGYEGDPNKVCRLRKALYGLRESPIAWYRTFNDYVKTLGFVVSNYDSCLYVNKNAKDYIYLLVFVDDLLICSRNLEAINNIKLKLTERFVMKDLGEIKSYIGIDINYYKNKNLMFLNQTKYIESLAEKYNLKEAKLYDTPMEAGLKLNQSERTDESIKYRNLIGELLYIGSGTRPDISYSVNYLSRFQNCYDSTHFKYALRVMKYLYRTKDLSLKYSRSEKAEKIDCFVDSDYAGDSVDRKSTSGYVIRMHGNVIFWKSKKQNVVAKCSTFAEYIALSEAVTEVLFIRNLCDEIFEMRLSNPFKIFEDNSGAVAIAKFGNFTKNSKHIEVQYHFINENYQKKIINIVKVETDRNLADMLTKALSKDKFMKNRLKLKLL